MPDEKNKKKEKSAKTNKPTGVGYNTTMRKATKEERIAVRATGARKLARKGILPELYSEEKGGRLVTSKNSGSTVTRSQTKSGQGQKSAHSSDVGGPSAGKYRGKSIAMDENVAFYGDTKLGRRLANKASKKGNTNVFQGGNYKKTEIKPRFEGKTS